jgi:teichuronic acid biosynthesis glycosyltransferase TuaG
MNPAVSVIMPVLNQEAWLGAAIDSVRSQRLTDWELLIIDDGSTDSSPAVAERYAAQDADRIRILSTAANHRGAAAARNAAMAAARGRYISFLDADDLYLREKLCACSTPRRKRRCSMARACGAGRTGGALIVRIESAYRRV